MAERTQLILAHLDLTRLTEDFFGHRHLLGITYCDLSFNRFDDIQPLIQLSNLEVLILDSNEINDNIIVQQLPLLPRLHTLSLNKNCLTDVGRVMRHLQRSTPAVRHLSTLSNPMCCSPMSNSDCTFDDYQRYRYQVLYHFPELEFLDSTPVKNSERVTAQRTGKYLRPTRIDVARQARPAQSVETRSSQRFADRSGPTVVTYNAGRNDDARDVTMDSLRYSPLSTQRQLTPQNRPEPKFILDDVDRGELPRVAAENEPSPSVVSSNPSASGRSSLPQVSFGTLKCKYVGVRSEGNRFIKDENL